MFPVFFAEAAIDGNPYNHCKKRLVVLGLIAEDFESSLFEQKEAVGRADLFGFGIDPLDFRIDQFRHDDFAVYSVGVLSFGVEFEFFDAAFDDVELLAVFVESDHQHLELFGGEGVVDQGVWVLLGLLLDFLAQELLVVYYHHF